ncbi:MAG TPA: hypothetical protein ENJ37_10320 [Deltaproteobacteria bacterium]|nr:hypothetical protein [Deltaproteobacteria bacterium]
MATTLAVIPMGLTHWLVDVLGGTEMERAFRGSVDGAVYTVDASGKVTIGAAEGGGRVRHVRGVWLDTVTFEWNGYWAQPDSQATDYFASFVNNPSDTVISLSPPLAEGTRVQVFYYHSTGQRLAPLTCVGAYPCWFRAYGGPFPFEVASSSREGKFAAAVDAEQWFVVACMEAWSATGAPIWKEFASTIMSSLREFDTGAHSKSFIDDFDYRLSDRRASGLYSGADSTSSIDFFDTVSDPGDRSNRVLSVKATVSASGYAYWGRSERFDLSASPDFEFTFTGTGSLGRYNAVLNTDPATSQDPNHVYRYGFADESDSAIRRKVPIGDFHSLANVVYSGNIRPESWWSYADTGSSISLAERYGRLYESDFIHYYGMELSWDLGTGAYVGAGVDVPSGVDSSSEADVNFFVDAAQATTLRVFVEDANSTQHYCDKAVGAGGRVTAAWSEFNGTPAHPVRKVFFQVTTSPAKGSCRIADIRFGPARTLAPSTVYYCQFDLPRGGSFEALFDDVGFDITPADDFPGLPYFSYQWNETGAMNWRGPSYAGYQVPAAYYRMGHADVASRMAAFLRSSQDEYASRYSAAKGPFMPVHTRGLAENADYDTPNTWTWNGPDTNTHWAGFQYRALSQLAHYYYLSGDATAKAVLDNWMAWLDGRIIGDPLYPGDPRGYLPPTTFVKDSGSYSYDYFSPDLHALIVQACIYKYWRDGDQKALLWHRRLLDDLVTNRKGADGSYKADYTYGFHNAEVGKALGMLITGRAGGAVNHQLQATAADMAAFEELYGYFTGSVGTVKPVAMSPQWLPLHAREATSQPIGEKVWVGDRCTTSETLSTALAFAVDYYKHSGEGLWMWRLGAYLCRVLVRGVAMAYVDELKKNSNRPNVIIEVALDGGLRKFGYHDGGFADVAPVLKKVSSLSNRLDTSRGVSTRGNMTFVLTGRENFRALVEEQYLKNRRVVRRDGFVAPGFTYLDYRTTFTGKIVDWSRKGDELTVTVADDLVDASLPIPVENTAKTQYIDYRAMNPVDIMADILTSRLGVASAYIDTAAFTSERDTWLSGWVFNRVLTEPRRADAYLNELQVETGSFLVHDGEKITFKVLAPPLPGQTIEEWTDDYPLIAGSLAQESGYRDLCNRVVVYYDYDESGGDGESAFESVYIAADAASQGPGEWDETKTKVIKSKWIRTWTWTQPQVLTGVTIYHVSGANGAGDGTLTYNRVTAAWAASTGYGVGDRRIPTAGGDYFYECVAAGTSGSSEPSWPATVGKTVADGTVTWECRARNNSLQWTAPGGTVGESVAVGKDGRYQVFDTDKTKYVRVVVDTSALPASTASETVTVTSLGGDTFAASLAGKILSRYRDPVSIVAFDIDINASADTSAMRKPTDVVDLTSDEAADRGRPRWTRERIMLTSVEHDVASSRLSVKAVQTRMYRRYGFIAPAGQPDYPSASAAQREYGYIGDGANKVGGEEGYHIW